MITIEDLNRATVPNFEERRPTPKLLADPKLWLVTATAAAVGGIVTVIVAVTIPEVAAACTIAAVALVSASLLFATTALLLHVIARRKMHASDRSAQGSLPVSPRENELRIENVVIRDPEQIAFLEQFSPETQLSLVASNILEPTEDLRWDAYELNDFTPEEINLILRSFGQKFVTLNFDNYRYPLESIDLSTCTKLKYVSFAYQLGLRTILGLGACKRLAGLYLDGCHMLNRREMFNQLEEIARPEIEISCEGSSLEISDAADLRSQFSPGGDWYRFLKSHPHAGIARIFGQNGLVLPPNFNPLSDFPYFQCQPAGQPEHLLRRKLREIIGNRQNVLSLFRKFVRNKCFELESLTERDTQGLTQDDLRILFHCLGGKSCPCIDLTKNGERSQPTMAGLWNGLEEFNLAEWRDLECLLIGFGANLKRLPNLGHCTSLQILALDVSLANLDEAQVKGEILKLNSLSELYVDCKNFAEFTAPELTQIFENNPNLQEINQGLNCYSRDMYV